MNKDFWERIDRLEELAGRATRGEWKRGYKDIKSGVDIIIYSTTDVEDAEYIAAANPVIIKEMIAELRRLRNIEVAGNSGRIIPDGSPLCSYSSYSAQPESLNFKPKFNVGDIVRIDGPVLPGWGNLAEKIGVTGIILRTNVKDATYQVQLSDRNWWCPEPMLCYASEPKKPKFRPFDKVLVRDTKSSEWRISFFSHFSADGEFNYRTMDSGWRYCIPYEGNETLLGTTNDPEKE